MTPQVHLPPAGSDPIDVVDAVDTWSTDLGRPLYPHQYEAALALAAGDHVVLATPTGSGKSLVATIGCALAVNRGERAVWTAPIKALVAEKFFDLVELFGAERVGLATGDASINTEAPIIVCTAEVLANRALTGRGEVGFACLDEFHYYADPDRGWAWQVPLLELTSCQFLLASATLGDMTTIVDDLETRTDRSVASVTSATRPTPLFHQWRTTPVAESVLEAVAESLGPVYVVHNTQLGAIERAQSLVSLSVTTREQREAIAAEMASVKMKTGFGQALDRLLRNGIGVHHAGMLPRHRRLVERLAGEGLLPVICGTDTLGVGINIPIRTVLMTSLTKFDGTRQRVMTAREFHQLAGRAGRPGFDPDGHVWAQAPDHVIENQRALNRVGDDAKARRKVVKAKPPQGFVHYDESTFERLVGATPEPLTSRFRVSADLVATVLGRPDGPEALRRLLTINHDPEKRRRHHKRRALAVYRSLEAAGIAERRRDDQGRCIGVDIGALIVGGGDDRTNVRLSSPLSTFAIEVVAALEIDEPDYVLDVISVVESIIDDPVQILRAQREAARGAAIAEMKAAGVPYEERMDRLEKITWPQPLKELIDSCFETYHSAHPWIDAEPSSKSIVREMIEYGDTFTTYVARYRLMRSEGLLLRYLTDVWRALDRSLADAAYVPLLEDLIEWLDTLVRATDDTLIREWERLIGLEADDEPTVTALAPTRPPPAWRTTMRTALFGWVELLAHRNHEALAIRTGLATADLDRWMAPYWAEHDWIGIDADARALIEIEETDSSWHLAQILTDPAGTNEWRLCAMVDLAEALDSGAPRLAFERISGPG